MKNFIIGLFLLFLHKQSYSQNIDTMPQMKYGVFYNLGNNAYKSIIGESSCYYLASVGISYGLVTTGADSKINLVAKDFGDWSTYVFAVPLLVGFVAPIAVPGAMNLFSKKNSKMKRAANAGLQAALISFTYNTSLKALTGRRPPIDNTFQGSNDELSRQFRFGFLRGGVYEGWPSGHSMTNIAVAVAIAEVYHDKPVIKWIAYGCSGLIAAGTAFGIKGEIHWFSDAIAGSLMGFAIGKTIGKSFRNENTNDENKLSISSNGTQIQLTYKF